MVRLGSAPSDQYQYANINAIQRVPAWRHFTSQPGLLKRKQLIPGAHTLANCQRKYHPIVSPR